MMLIARIRVATLLAMTLTSLAWTAPALRIARPGDPAGQVQARPDGPTSPVQPPRTDRYGDPLPPGAVMRLGSLRFRNERGINHIAYSPDGRLLVTDDRRRFFQLWDPKTGQKLRRIDSGLEDTRYFEFSPDGKTLVAAGNEYDPKRNSMIHRLTFTELATGRQVRRGEWDDPKNVRRVFYTPDGKSVVTVTDTGGIQLWDVATMKIVYREPSGDSRGSSLAVSPAANSHLLAIIRSSIIRFWDTEQRREVRTIGDEMFHATDVAFTPDGTAVVANMQRKESNDHEFWLFRVSDGAQLGRFASAKTTSMYAMTFSPDGKVLAAIGDRDQVETFDVNTGRELDLFPTARAAELPLVFSPDGNTLTTLDGEQALHFWDRTTGQDRLATPDDHQDPVTSIAFVGAGKTLVSVGRDQTVRFWDLATGRA